MFMDTEFICVYPFVPLTVDRQVNKAEIVHSPHLAQFGSYFDETAKRNVFSIVVWNFYESKIVKF